MRWIITKDLISEPDEGNAVGYNGDKGFVLARMRDAKKVEQFAANLPVMFKLLDDDGEVYFTGKCDDPALYDESQAFGALDWAMPSFGCTTFKFYNKATKCWEVL